MSTVAIILAGGEGGRFGLPKQFVSINKKPLFVHSIELFKEYEIVLAVPLQFKDIIHANMNDFCPEISNRVHISDGGKRRQDSVFNALNVAGKLGCQKILISEIARPCLTIENVHKVEIALDNYSCAITVAKCIDTVCRVDSGQLIEVINRKDTYNMLMPQGFHFKEIYEAHKQYKGCDVTDDTVVLKSLYPESKIKCIEISQWEGLKLTHIEGYSVMDLLLRKK